MWAEMHLSIRVRGNKEEKVIRASDIKYNSTWYILTAINKPNKTNVTRSM